MAIVLDAQLPPTSPISVPVPGKDWGVEPVELLVSRKVEVVPEIYRREFEPCDVPREHIPRNPLEKRVPVIDLGGWEGCKLEGVVSELKRACETWGFFRIVNHGVSTKLMERMMEVGKEFMALSPEEKVMYAAEPGYLSQGYGSKYIIKEDKVRDWRDYLYLHLQPHSIRKYNVWPTNPSDFREVMSEYSEEVKSLALKLLAAISMSLGLDPKYIEKALGEGGVHQKTLFNYYPVCPQPKITAGFHRHSDFGALTVLLQEEGVVGLEVRHQNDWVPAHPIKHSFVINVGDQVEVISNGMYKSIEHRAVVNKDKSRLSIPLFHDAAPNALIAPAKELEQGPIYKEAKFSDFEDTFFAYGAKGKSIVQSYIIEN